MLQILSVMKSARGIERIARALTSCMRLRQCNTARALTEPLNRFVREFSRRQFRSLGGATEWKNLNLNLQWRATKFGLSPFRELIRKRCGLCFRPRRGKDLELEPRESRRDVHLWKCRIVPMGSCACVSVCESLNRLQASRS